MTQLIEAPLSHKLLPPPDAVQIVRESTHDLGDMGRKTLVDLFQLKPGEVVSREELERRAHLAKSVIDRASSLRS